MQKLSPQNEVIFNHLLRGGTLTALEAVQQPFGTTCLAKRISEIEATGVTIDKTWETKGKKRWYRYSYHLGAQDSRNEFAEYGNFFEIRL